MGGSPSPSSSANANNSWKEILTSDWVIRSFWDWVTLLLSGLLLLFVANKTLIDEYKFCIPAWTLDKDGNYECGDLKNAAWTYPEVDWSIGSFDSFVIGWTPFFFVFVFNIIYFKVPRFRKTIPFDNIPSNFEINTSIIRWLDVTLRCMVSVSVVTTLLGQICKFVTGLPRPNAYTLLEGDFRTGMFACFFIIFFHFLCICMYMYVYVL